MIDDSRARASRIATDELEETAADAHRIAAEASRLAAGTHVYAHENSSRCGYRTSYAGLGPTTSMS